MDLLGDSLGINICSELIEDNIHCVNGSIWTNCVLVAAALGASVGQGLLVGGTSDIAPDTIGRGDADQTMENRPVGVLGAVMKVANVRLSASTSMT